MHSVRWSLLLLQYTAFCAASVVRYPVIRQDVDVDLPSDSTETTTTSRVMMSGNTTLITTTSSTSSSTSTVITTTSTTSSSSSTSSTSTTPSSTSTSSSSTVISTSTTTPSSTKASPTPTTHSSAKATSTKATSTKAPSPNIVPSSTAELKKVPDNSTASIEISSTVHPNTTTHSTTTLPTTTSHLNSTTTISSATSSASVALRCGKDSGSFVTPPSKSMKMSSIKACKSACQADSKCKSFEFGTIDGNGNSCWFFDEPVSKLKLGDATEGFTWNFFDVGCQPSSRCGQEGKFVSSPTKKMKVANVKACKDACQADSNCQAFESGDTDNSGDNCWLFDTAVWDLEVGAPAPGFTWTFYDRDCSV